MMIDDLLRSRRRIDTNCIKKNTLVSVSEVETESDCPGCARHISSVKLPGFSNTGDFLLAV